MISSNKKYVVYTSDKLLVDSAFALLEGAESINAYKAKILCDLQTSENGNNRISVFTASDNCYDWFCGLDGIEFLGCADSHCRHACRENPSEHFTDDDWAKVDLANARGLF